VQPEPWLRGITPGLDPVIAHLLRAAQHLREDVENAARGLSPEQVWSRGAAGNPVGFHLKHLAGSTDRLITYLHGQTLSEDQIAALRNESDGRESADELIDAVNVSLHRYEQAVRALDPAAFAAVRKVGRAGIEVTAISLAIHIAEHGQRHAGQLVSAAALARALVP
jgi:uncharacterized damage-inducible protein DinB